MSASSTFSLLYQIQAQGIEALDGISKKQQQINLETKYSSQNLKQFDELLKSTTSDGTRLAKALDDISRSGTNFAAMAKDVVANDRAMQASMRETAQAAQEAARVKIAADREAQKSANLAYQTRLRIAKADERLRKSEEVSNLNSIKSLTVLAGVKNSRALDSVIGRNAGSLAIPALAATATIGAGFEMVKSAAQDARELQNLADEMGITAQEAFKLQAASRLVGIDLGTMSMAAGRLATALEEPNGAGKKTAETLAKLGVDVNNGMGNALESVLQKLSQIPDHAKAIEVAREVFGRTGAQMVEVADSIEKVGQSLDDNVQKKLLEANQRLEEFGNSWTIWKGKGAAAIVSVVGFLDQLDARTRGVLNGFGGSGAFFGNFYDDERHKDMLEDNEKALQRFGMPKPHTVDVTGAMELLRDGSKEGIDFQIAEARKAKEAAEGTLSRTILKGTDDKAELKDEMALVSATRKEYEKLEAAKKAAASGPSAFAELQRQIRDTVAGYNERSIGSDDPVQRLLIERDKKITDLQSNPRYQGFGSTLSQGVRQIRGAALGEILEAQTKQRDKEAKAQFLLDESMQKAGIANSKEFNRQGETDLRGVGLLGMPSDSIGIASPGLSAKQQNELSRIAVRGQSSIIGNTASTDTQALMQTIALRRQENDLIEQAAIIEANRFDGQAKQDELEKAAFDRRKADLDTEIELRTRIAEIGLQQKEETRSFSEGLFTAGMSGQSGGVSQYLHNFGMGLATKAIGNASDAILPSFNKVFSLGRTGALGTPENPNFLGKLAKGTPFDWSAEELKKHTDMVQTAAEKEKNQPLITSQGQLKDSIDALTRTLGGSAPSGGGARTGGPSGSSDVFSGLSRILGAPGGTAPFLSRGSTSSGSGSLSDLIQDGLNIPLSATAGHSADVSAIASLVATQSANVAGGYSLAGTSSFGLPNGTSGGSAASGTSAISKISGGLGQLFGGASTIFGGHALQGIFTGGMDNGDGTGQALSGLGRVGAAAGLAGGTYAGISGAISGFGQGGGRGISKGIGSALGTASMYDPEPISHAVLQTGAAIAGIVSSMFGDPVANRQKAIDQALTNDQYVQPNAHNYSYSGSGGGVDFGADGSMRGGAKQAGYTVNVSAMDAKSLYDTLQRNGQAFGTNLAQSIGSSGVGALASEVSWHALHP